MSWLGLGLVLLAVICLVLAIACQLDAMEIRWERRNRELMERWEANQRGSARVVDFQAWRERKRDERGAA